MRAISDGVAGLLWFSQFALCGSDLLCKPLLIAVSGVFGLKCGVQHTGCAVVSRKSGSPEMPDDDFCTVLLVQGLIREGRGGCFGLCRRCGE